MQFGELLAHHRAWNAQQIADLTRNHVSVCVVPVYGYDYQEWQRGSKEEGNVISKYCQWVSQYRPGEFLVFGAYPMPKFGIGVHPARYSKSTLVQKGEKDDSLFIAYLRHGFPLAEYEPSSVQDLMGGKRCVVTPFGQEATFAAEKGLLDRMAMEAYAFGAPASDAIADTEGRFVVNKDQLYTPPKMILVENFASDLPIRAVLYNGDIQALLIARLDCNRFSRVIWRNMLPKEEQRLAVVLEALKFLNDAARTASHHRPHYGVASQRQNSRPVARTIGWSDSNARFGPRHGGGKQRHKSPRPGRCPRVESRPQRGASETPVL